MELFPQEIVTLSSQKYGFGNQDPGSEKTYSRSRIQGAKRHPIPDPDRSIAFNQQKLLESNRYPIQDPDLFGANLNLVLHIRK